MVLAVNWPAQAPMVGLQASSIWVSSSWVIVPVCTAPTAS